MDNKILPLSNEIIKFPEKNINQSKLKGSITDKTKIRPPGIDVDAWRRNLLSSNLGMNQHPCKKLSPILLKIIAPKRFDLEV